MKIGRAVHLSVAALVIGLMVAGLATDLQAQLKKPNILFIMGDDVGWYNIGAYHRGMMAGALLTSTSSPLKA